MGMFDSVIMKCPKCGGVVEWQSKAGECCLATYSPDSMPPVIAADINGEIAGCRSCDAGYVIGERKEEGYVSLPVHPC